MKRLILAILFCAVVLVGCSDPQEDYSNELCCKVRKWDGVEHVNRYLRKPFFSTDENEDMRPWEVLALYVPDTGKRDKLWSEIESLNVQYAPYRIEICITETPPLQ